MTADLASLGFAIDSRPLAEASTAMDDMAEAAGRAEAGAAGLQGGTDRLAAATRNTVVALSAAGRSYSDLGTQVRAASGAVDQFVARAPRVATEIDREAEAVKRAAAQWRAYGEAGRQAVQSFDLNRRASAALGGLSSTGGVPMAPAPGRASVANDNGRAFQLQNLAFQGGDVIASLASGGGLGRIALQQGPQIAQSFMGPNALSGADVFGAIATGASRAVGFITSAAGAMTGFAGAVLVAVSAQQSYSASQTELARSLAGAGRASGESVASLNAAATAAAAASGISERAARGLAGTYAATGKISGDVLEDLIRRTRDYARTTGQDLEAAGGDLAKAFADPAKGAAELNQRLGILNDTQQRNIETLAAEGNRLGAQRALMEAMNGSLARASELTTGWARLTQAAGTAVSDTWDRIGRAVDRAVTGGSLDEQLANAEARLGNVTRNNARPGLFGPASSLQAQIQDEVDQLRMQRDDRNRRTQQVQANLNSIEIGNLRRSLDPAGEQLRDLTNQAQKLRTAISDPIKWGLDASALAATEAAFERISRQAMALRMDVERFGGAGTAAAVRAAELQNRTATMAGPARSVAEREEVYRQALINRGLDPNATRDAVLERFNPQFANDNLGPRELQAIANAREESLRAVAEREALQRVRDLGNDTTRQQTLMGTGQFRTNVRDLPEQYRDRVYQAATRRGIDPNLLATVFEQESRLRPDVISGQRLSPAGAIGPFQFMPGTAREYGIDPRDFDQSADAAALYLRRSLTRRNGNVALALADYNAGAGRVDSVGGDVTRLPAETRAYLARTLQARPQSEDLVSAERERRTAIRQDAEALRLATEANGRDAEGLRARTEAQQAIIREQGRGVDVSKEYAASLRAEAAERARIVSGQRMLQYGLDAGFERDQLGRDSATAAAFSRARSVVGDTDSAAAQSIIATEQMTAGFREIKSAANGALSGFLTDARQGVSLVTSIGNLTGRIADRFLTLASDRVVSSILGGLMGGSGSSGGGLLSGLASILGGGSLPKFARGGITSGPSIAGEAGPEAVIPLSGGRTVPVQLNQPANSNPSPVFQTVVNNYSSERVQTREVPDGRGGRRQEVIIGEAFANGLNTPQGQDALSQPRLASR